MKTFSIIVPVKPGRNVAAIEHLKKSFTDLNCFEVLLSEGSAPSQQRNTAAREAKGDILYFLDDDSLINPENLATCADIMSESAVAVVGGPSLTPYNDTQLQLLFGDALASPFGSGGVSHRYCSYGKLRETTDKELILCNLAVRRSLFHELGGFNESLYPNEENEFLERVSEAGYKLIHNPDMYVYRSQRKTLKAFIRQMFSYGRGRGEQTLITRKYSFSSFIPLFFVVYIISAVLFIKYDLLLLPLMLYLCANFLSTLIVLYDKRRIFSVYLLALYPLMHFVNGLGLIRGLINGKPDPVYDCSVRVSRVKAFGEQFK